MCGQKGHAINVPIILQISNDHMQSCQVFCKNVFCNDLHLKTVILGMWWLLSGTLSLRVYGYQSKHLSSLRINLEQSNYCVCVIKPWASFVRLINCSLSSWIVCSSGYLCDSCVSCCERVVMIVTWQELQSLSLQDKRPLSTLWAALLPAGFMSCVQKAKR